MNHDTRVQFEGLFSIYEWILVVIAGVVIATVIGAAIVYGRRRDREPSQREKANKVELGYAAIVCGLIAMLVYSTFRVEGRVDSLAATGPSVRVDVTAFQWGWRFSYPGQNVTVVGNVNHPPTFAVPTGTTVRFAETSLDVVHSFWIPEMRFKRDAWPYNVQRFDLYFDSPGTHVGRCAEFCGLNHAGMDFQVVAMSPSRFRAWLDAHRGAKT